jgi:hypothetical protein
VGLFGRAAGIGRDRRCAGCWRGDEEFKGVVGEAGRFPRKASKGHAGEYYGEGPDICGLGVVFVVIVYFRGKIGI